MRRETSGGERLTGADNIYGSGEAVKDKAIVLSVSETNWSGNAGNGLGTLNGYVQAARKAQELGLITTGVDLSEKNLSEKDILTLVKAFNESEYVKGKSVFMFHTAGKGTRTAPLPGVEGNAKPNIKLPSMIEAGGKNVPLTILESVLIQTRIYAEEREDRLSVFWGDQVIINENDVTHKPTHHAEIYGQLVPINEELESFGLLIPGENGSVKQREKLKLDQIRTILPDGADAAYKSIGSFNLTQALLALMIEGHIDYLSQAKGKLDSDPDWWQPLTSNLEDTSEEDGYKTMMAKKGKSEGVAVSQYERMRKIWDKLNKGKLDSVHALGYTDVGRHSLWWDYGQNAFYLNNMQILTEKVTTAGRAARQFFGVDSWIADSVLGTNTTVAATVAAFPSSALADGNANEAGVLSIEGSVVLNSTIRSGSLKNCVVINSTLTHVVAENAVIIGSTILELNAIGGLVYNVVTEKESVKEGQIVANIFHPNEGRIEMRTTTSNNGSVDWENFVSDNAYTYDDISTLMGQPGVTFEAVERVKADFIANVMQQTVVTGITREEVSSAAEKLSWYRADKAEDLGHEAREALRAGDRAKAAELSLRAQNAAIEEQEAYIEVLARMLTSGLLQPSEMTLDRFMELVGPEYYTEYAGSGAEARRYAQADLDALLERIELEKVDRAKYFEEFYQTKEGKPLKFGTSGLRDTVDHFGEGMVWMKGRMSDQEVYINARGFVKYLIEAGEVEFDDTIHLAGDLRPSTPMLMRAVAEAIKDEGRESGYNLKVEFDGFVPSPAVANRGFVEGHPSIMVTGSHIPADRNGIKFNKKSGEVLKPDEKRILTNVAKARKEEISKPWHKALFTKDEKI